jgi:hypothetical protein
MGVLGNFLYVGRSTIWGTGTWDKFNRLRPESGILGVRCLRGSSDCVSVLFQGKRAKEVGCPVRSPDSALVVLNIYAERQAQCPHLKCMCIQCMSCPGEGHANYRH